MHEPKAVYVQAISREGEHTMAIVDTKEACHGQMHARRAGDFEDLLSRADSLDEPAARADTEIAVINYASGVTGIPNGAEFNHANLRGSVTVVVDMLGLTASDVILGALRGSRNSARGSARMRVTRRH
jgi:long-subunit acyl-CoA synthetase (AMP-forming)